MRRFGENKLVMIKTSEIESSPNKQRKVFDEYELKLLADSIVSNGMIQPLAVRRRADGKYCLICGERRLKAAKMAGIKRVPCVIHKIDEKTAALFALGENIQRNGLNPFEEAAAIENIAKEYDITHTEIAVRLGIAGSSLLNKLRLLKLNPDLQQRIVTARLTERHARALLRIPDEERKDVLDEIIAEGLTVRQTEDRISRMLTPEVKEEEPKEPVRKAAIGDLRLFSNSLEKLVETLKCAGISADSEKYENKNSIEYTVKIHKSEVTYEQLRIC